MPFKTAVQARWNAVAALRVAGYTEGYATFWNGNIMVELSNVAFDIRVWNPGEELQDPDKGTVEFENENYITYGYPSYDEMRADFFD